MRTRRWGLARLPCLLAASSSASVSAQPSPAKAIDLIAPLVPGDRTSITAPVLAGGLEERPLAPERVSAEKRAAEVLWAK
jgi:hypothetical protein